MVNLTNNELRGGIDTHTTKYTYTNGNTNGNTLLKGMSFYSKTDKFGKK
jgi:hypothetical protein